MIVGGGTISEPYHESCIYNVIWLAWYGSEIVPLTISIRYTIISEQYNVIDYKKLILLHLYSSFILFLVTLQRYIHLKHTLLYK